MEKTAKSEQELENKPESTEEKPSTQMPEPQAEAKKEEEVDPFKKMQDDLAEAKDKYVRLYAEFDNHRRRTAKEKLEMIQSANEQLIVALLPVMDDFERAEKSFAEKKDSASEGFLLIQQKLKKVMDQYGVKAMETPVESDFNPDLHEAITQLPAPEEKLKGKIVDTIEKGYLLNDKVIRHAKVVIGN